MTNHQINRNPQETRPLVPHPLPRFPQPLESLRVSRCICRLTKPQTTHSVSHSSSFANTTRRFTAQVTLVLIPYHPLLLCPPCFFSHITPQILPEPQAILVRLPPPRHCLSLCSALFVLYPSPPTPPGQDSSSHKPRPRVPLSIPPRRPDPSIPSSNPNHPLSPATWPVDRTVSGHCPSCQAPRWSLHDTIPPTRLLFVKGPALLCPARLSTFNLRPYCILATPPTARLFSPAPFRVEST